MKLRDKKTNGVRTIVIPIVVSAFIFITLGAVIVAIIMSCLNYHYEYTTTSGETGTASNCYHQTGKVPVCWDGNREIYDIKELKRVRN